MPEAALIRVEAVDFAYGATPVLTAVDLRVRAGELVCIVGPNGAGKTTLLRLIGGLCAPDEGRVRCFEDLDPARLPRRRLARRLAYVPQSYNLAFPFTVLEVVLMGRYAHGGRSLYGLENQADVEEARAAMARCDVLALAERRFDEISGGERRRALLAQAFCQRAEVILLDEPTAALDPRHAIGFFDALRAERDRRGATAVIVTHDLNLAARFGDRVAILADHTICADGAPAEVLASEAAARAFGVDLHVDHLPGTDTPFVVPR